MRIRRRGMLALLASLPATFLASPAWTSRPGGKRPSDLGDLVDAHCHVFNVTDLTATKFALAFMGIYGRPTGAERKLEGLIRKIVDGLSANVPTAAAEAEELGARLLAPPGVARLTAAEEVRVDDLSRQAEAAAHEVERDQARRPRGPADRCWPTGDGGIAWSVRAAVRWVKALKLGRQQMVKILAARHLAAGYRPRLLCPALVDYSNWLDEKLTSPLPDQICVMGKIAALADLPPVHGYAPFDPLRHALFKCDRPSVDGDWNPMGLVHEALTEHGFAGVKLYPPMGFRPGGNADDKDALYPERAAELPGGAAAVGAHLDSALDDLWEYCTQHDVPIMAHGANSNEGGKFYGYRADPTHWVALLARRPRLRVMLGHFGGFESVALGHGVPKADCPRPVPFEDSWEGVIGRYVKQNPDSHLYADISFLGEIYGRRSGERSAELLKQYLCCCDPEARHLVFGSDWVMLGLHKGWGKRPFYAARVAAFLRDCGIAGERLDGVMQGNALRFLGLGDGDSTRERLLQFYAGHRLPAERLPLAAGRGGSLPPEERLPNPACVEGERQSRRTSPVRT